MRFSVSLFFFLFVVFHIRRPKKVVPLHVQKLRTLYDTIKDYHDAKGRQLSLIFMKLPNKNEYPDYYEVIKQPIHMEKIASTLKNNGYENLDELVSDFILMFDNACKYNEPDSQIYKVCMTNIPLLSLLLFIKVYVMLYLLEKCMYCKNLLILYQENCKMGSKQVAQNYAISKRLTICYCLIFVLVF